MSRPPVFPQQSASGIAVHPRTLERVIPESRRSDGSVRKEIRIRPGFTPQEDVTRFRGTRQQAMDVAALPKGHIMGWVAPSSESQKGTTALPPNRNAKKRANQRAKKAAEKAAAVRESWEDDEDAESSATPASKTDGGSTESLKESTPNTEPTQGEAEIADKLSKLEVK